MNLRPATTSCRRAFRDDSCIDDGEDFRAKPPTKRPAASNRLLGSRLGRRYRLQAGLVGHFGVGATAAGEWTCTSKLDPYRGYDIAAQMLSRGNKGSRPLPGRRGLRYFI
jgi:hypothetical protein